MNPRLRVTAFAGLATLLGSLSLLPIYSTYGWLPRVILVIAAVTATSAIAHRVRALVVVAPLLTVVVLVALLTLLYAHGVAPLGFVPGPAAMRSLHKTLSDGFTDTTQMAAPVELTRGLSLMTTGGIGLVAVVVETMATGLRRPAIAGLPLLAIFTVPAAILNDGVGWRPFVFGAAGYLALLLAEGRERITRWGRPVRAERGPSGRSAAFGAQLPAQRRQPQSTAFGAATRAGTVTNQLTQVGRRVGLAAISVAVVVPAIIPGLHSGWFGTHHTNGVGIGAGGSGSTTINPIVSLRRDLTQTTPQPLFTYTTTGTPDYLRMLTLDTFDGTDWTPAPITSAEDIPADRGLPTPVGLSVQPTATVTTDVAVSGLKEPYLPVPMVPTEIKASGSWLYNPVTFVIYSKHSSTIRLNYQVTSDVYDPTAAVLNSVVIDPDDPATRSYLEIPDKLPSTIKAQADDIITQAHAVTAYQKAVALQDWFRDNFTYDLSVKPGSDADALVSFLRDRTGYCEQFAATMALMARMEGIPSRVDIGFTPGTKVPGTDTYLVTTADAHSWPELYFAGAGWLRFEPTPRGDGQTTQPVYTTATAIPTTGATGPAASAQPQGNDRLPTTIPGGNPLDPHQNGVGSFGGGANSGAPIGWLVVLFLVVVAAIAAPTLRWRVRRRRWSNARTATARAHAAWAELGDDLRDLGIDWRGAIDTPRRAVASLLATRRLHDQAVLQALSRLARAEELARYASPATQHVDDADPRADERLVRRALFASATRTRRLRAKVAPPSTGSLLGSAMSTVSGYLRGLTRRVGDAATARLPAR